MVTKSLSHVDEQGRPRMVDVTAKAVTQRRALAQCEVRLPMGVVAALTDEQGALVTKKGPVFATAIVAGVMAAKRTHELIPFCHPLGLSGCDVRLVLDGQVVSVSCECRVQHKTGVEMEALTGASVAALTVYDMCKALSHDIEITALRLVEKTGGKSDYAHLPVEDKAHS
ncbi:MAG: cyclic pyranopterin monophosphate synthase MoaC [Pseudomonadota bacterium]